MNLTDDLTNGIIWKQLTALALPLIWGNILQQMYNTIDSFVVGHYIGETAFAAAGVAGSVMNLSLFVISGCCNGIAIIIAELYGQKNWDLLRKESFLSLAFGGGFTIMLSMCGMLALQPLLRGIQTPAEVAGFVQEYLKIIYLGLPAVFLYNWCAAVLRGAGDTRASLWILLLAMGLNTILDFLFVLSFGLGMAGTAYATVVSQLFAAFICLGYMKKQTPKLLFHARDASFHFPLFTRTIMLGTISALHQSSLYIGKLLVQGTVNTGGTGMIPAYTATARIEGFANSFGDSGCTAISIFTAQNRGAYKRVRIRQGFLCGLRMMAGLGLVLSITMFLTSGPAVILLMGAASGPVLNHARSYMNVISVFYVLCFLGNSFVGFYRGLGMVQVPVLGTILHISIRVILSYALIRHWGLATVAFATGAGWAAVVLFQWILYRRVTTEPEA